jgi:ribosomal-protein-alanine N-acetyltransferase
MDFAKDQSYTFPVLETERLMLREIQPLDAVSIFELYRNPAVMQYRGAPVFASLQEARDLEMKFRKQFAAGEGIRWGLVLKGKGNSLIGTGGIRSVSWQHLRTEIGYEIDPKQWNRGLMTEALTEITRYCFECLKLHTIEANIAPANLASARVLEKLAFVKEAHFRENWYYQGWWDSIIYTLHNATSSMPEGFAKNRIV